MKKLQITVFLIALLALSVHADLPVHCLKHQIVGEWQLSLTSVKASGPGFVTCGHQIPDNQDTSYNAGFNEFKESSNMNLILTNDNTVHDEKKTASGSWTMVYDEGFEITFNNIKYFAFSKYEPNGGRDYRSECGQTLVGWYNNVQNGEKGCYKASKKGESVEANDSLEMRSVVQPEFMDLRENEDDRHFQSLIELHQGFNDHNQIVDHLNTNVKKSWTARLHPEFEGKTIAELNSMAGRKKYHSAPRMSLVQLESAGSADVSDFPQSFSWHQILDTPRQQRQCGSCYTISTMSMLSARLRMQGENVQLSPQYSVDCNYYNQGCDGGYPFLVEKFFSENYLATEQEYPYQAETGNCKKINFEAKSKNYKISNYRYIGGAYGTSDMREIMKEIQENGPIVMNFEPAYDFMHYGGGVYHSSQSSDWSNNGYSMPEWEKVDHSVLCYGWGEENGEKYWLLQNSWGSQWGENGSFRMRRGTDESAIESMAESADPIIVTNNSRKSFLQQDDYENSAFVQQKQYIKA